MPRKKAKVSVNLLEHKTATVSLHRNGLTIEIASVAAPDAALVAQALLDAIRGMVQAGYDELVQDAGGVHAGPLGEVPDEDGIEEAADPPVARRTRRPIGFR